MFDLSLKAIEELEIALGPRAKAGRGDVIGARKAGAALAATIGGSAGAAAAATFSVFGNGDHKSRSRNAIAALKRMVARVPEVNVKLTGRQKGAGHVTAILTRLVALNKERAAEEAKGLIRWLRPEFQAPGAEVPKVNATLDLGDTPAAVPATVIPWPKTLAEQVSTVAAILAASPAPQQPSEIARAIKGTNAKGVTPVLDALAAIGQARKLADGRFAA